MVRRNIKLYELKFVEAYLATGNASEAVRQAKPECKNPDVLGDKLLGRKIIQDALKVHLKKAHKRIEITADQAVLAAKRVLEADPRRMVDAEGRKLPVSQMPDDIALACDFEVDDNGIKYKLARGKQIENALRINGLLKEQVDLTSGNLPIGFFVSKGAKERGVDI